MAAAAAGQSRGLHSRSCSSTAGCQPPSRSTPGMAKTPRFHSTCGGVPFLATAGCGLRRWGWRGTLRTRSSIECKPRCKRHLLTGLKVWITVMSCCMSRSHTYKMNYEHVGEVQISQVPGNLNCADRFCSTQGPTKYGGCTGAGHL